jgi:hypothetical protein
MIVGMEGRDIDWKVFGLLLIIAFFGFILLFAVSQGAYLTMQITGILFILGGVFLVVLLFAFLIWYFFFYHPIPILSKAVKEDILRASHISKSPHLKDLWLRGDAEHQGVYLGRITGWTFIPRKVIIDEDFLEVSKKQKEELKKKHIKSLLINESYFASKPKGFLSFLKPEEITVAIEDAWSIKENTKGEIIHKELLPDLKQHSPLVGDVELFGCALNKVGRYFYLPSYASSPQVDKIQMGDSFRLLSHLTQDEMAGAVDRASKSNVEHKFALEKEKWIDPFRNQQNKGEGGGNP